MRLACIDFGSKRIGIALSDPMGILASPFAQLEAGVSLKACAEAILNALKAHQLSLILVGLPLNMDGTDSKQTQIVRKFIIELQALTPIPIQTIDERLSSMQVERVMRDSGMRRKDRTGKVDSAVAAMLLQSYLDRPKP